MIDEIQTHPMTVEKVTQHYATALSAPVKLFRVGQLCGHSSLGVWNSTEMYAS